MNRKQFGLTLFELLFALLIGSIVISGSVSILSNSIKKEQLLAAEAEIQETLSYANNRLSFIFKEALSSPCGSIENMLATDANPSVSKLKVALLNGDPQPINIILQDTNSRNATIAGDEFPMLVPGIAGKVGSSGLPLEPLDNNGQPFSRSLPNIVDKSEYVIVMETSEKILINSSNVNGVGGGSAAGGLMAGLTAIPTSQILTGVGSDRTPFIITDCEKADIFRSNGNVTSSGIPVANDLYFHAYYKASESVISPISLYAYYIANVNGRTQLRRRNLTMGLSSGTLAASQPLVDGITNLQFSWGLGLPGDASAQAYFSTENILDGKVNIGDFRRNVISVKATVTARAANNSIMATERSRVGGVTTETRKPLSRTATHTYTIRNKMLRI